MGRVLRLAVLAVLLGLAAASCPAGGGSEPEPAPTSQLTEGGPTWP